MITNVLFLTCFLTSFNKTGYFMILERGESKNVHKSIFLENSESRHLCVCKTHNITSSVCVCMCASVHERMCMCVCMRAKHACVYTYLKEILDTGKLFHPFQCVFSNDKVSTVVSIRR